MNELIFSFWSGPLTEMASLSLRSWVKQGYNVHLYTDNYEWLNDHDTFPLAQYGKIIIKDYRQIVSQDEWEHFATIVQKSDFFRFKYLRDKGGIYCDLDLVLLKKIPNREVIICSEYTLQKGGRKSKLPQKPSIFFLKFPPNHEIPTEFVEKMLKAKYKEDTTYTYNIGVWNKMITKKNVEIAEPWEFAPINWSNVKEMFLNDKNLIPQKYGIQELSWNEILEKSIGIHFWNNFHKQKKIVLGKATDNSIYKYVKNLH